METSNPIVKNALAANAYRSDQGTSHKEWKQIALAATDEVYRFGLSKLQDIRSQSDRLIGQIREHGHPKETEAILAKQKRLEAAVTEFQKTARRIIGL